VAGANPLKIEVKAFFRYLKNTDYHLNRGIIAGQYQIRPAICVRKLYRKLSILKFLLLFLPILTKLPAT